MAKEFGAANGHSFEIMAGPMGQVRAWVEGGEPADMIVASVPVMESFLMSGAVVMGSETVLGSIGIGVAVREGTPHPDISTVENFRAAMLAAASVAHMDPAAGASSGIATARVFTDLGIADAMAAKTRLLQSGYSAELVARGEAELAIQNVSELLAVDGVEIVGMLPDEIQTRTTYIAGIAAQSANREAIEAFLEYLTRPETAERWREAGIELGAP
jgi:molybdate transport system substrate-binding protein